MVAVLGDIENDDDDFGEAHDINVTPFIDVMLVLLIIFMVAAPLSTVDLPSSTAVPQPKPEKPIYVTIKSHLAVAVGETAVKRVDLVSSLDAMSGAMSGTASGEGKDRRIFQRADRTVTYGEPMDVLERLRLGGFNKIALVAQEGVPGDPAQPGAADVAMRRAGADRVVATTPGRERPRHLSRIV
ncbi:MAG: biopolymer transporter ExbD [Xanthobacteraceae bacterium]|jgi:biopolymer transport protein ExbD